MTWLQKVKEAYKGRKVKVLEDAYGHIVIRDDEHDYEQGVHPDTLDERPDLLEMLVAKYDAGGRLQQPKRKPK